MAPGRKARLCHKAALSRSFSSFDFEFFVTLNGMDMTAALRYFSDHIEHVIGGLVVLFLLTSILLLIRNINSTDGQKEHGAGDSSRSGSDDLDIGAIESAMKRVLAAQGLTSLTAAASAAGDSAKAPVSVDLASADSTQLNQAIQERDTKLQELAREIDRLNSEVAAQKSAPNASGGDSGDGKVGELQQKIEELQARLSEYEIIEDDIADLSLFKEENAQLKAELERLRAESSAAPAASAPAEVEPPPATESEALLSALVEEAQEIAAKEPAPAVDPGANPAQAGINDLLASMGLGGAPAAASGPSPAAEAAPEKDPAKLVSQEEIDRLFALAPTESKPPVATTPEATPSDLDEQADAFVQVDLKDSDVPEANSTAAGQPVVEDESQLAATADELSAIANPSVFDATLDTDKMLSEVEALGEGGEGEDVLSGSLDTEKLLQEMSGIDESDKKPASDVAPKPAAAAAQAPAPASAATAAPFNPDNEEDSIGEDDLLAEFKDPTDGGQR